MTNIPPSKVPCPNDIDYINPLTKVLPNESSTK
jgi:hypothetical protein